MSGDLKPCPFCGIVPRLEQPMHSKSDEWWGVVCRSGKNLGGTCAISQAPSRTKGAAIARWNQRASNEVHRDIYLSGYNSGFYSAGNYFPEQSWERYLKGRT